MAAEEQGGVVYMRKRGARKWHFMIGGPSLNEAKKMIRPSSGHEFLWVPIGGGENVMFTVPESSATEKRNPKKKRRKKVKKNPKSLADRTAEASGRFKVLIGSAIFARKGSGPRLHFDGKKFTTNGKPKFFRSQEDAIHVAGDLAVTHARILRDYAITVETVNRRGKA